MVIPSQALFGMSRDGVETKSELTKRSLSMKARISTVSYKRSLIIGTLLGNGYSRQWKTKSGQLKAQLAVRHDSEYADLAEWKAEEFGRLFDMDIAVRQDKVSGKVQFSITRGKRIRVADKWFCRSGKKIISDKIRFMDHPVGMAMLLCDRGFVKRHKKRHKDGTEYYAPPALFVKMDGFSENDAERLSDHIRSLCGAEARIKPEKGKIADRNEADRSDIFSDKGPRLNFNAANSRMLWEYVNLWIPQVFSMSAKFLFIIEKYGMDQSDDNSRHLSPLIGDKVKR